MSIESCDYRGNEAYEESFANWRTGIISDRIESLFQSEPDTVSSLKLKTWELTRQLVSQSLGSLGAPMSKGRIRWEHWLWRRHQACLCSAFLFFLDSWLMADILPSSEWRANLFWKPTDTGRNASSLVTVFFCQSSWHLNITTVITVLVSSLLVVGFPLHHMN